MPEQRLQQKASRVTRFMAVQLIALIGWIIVQSFFSLSAPGQAIPTLITIVVEAVWWIITLVIMFLLFKREYQGFVQAALDLENANRRLREATNRFLHNLKSQDELNLNGSATPIDQTESGVTDQSEVAHEPVDTTEDRLSSPGEPIDQTEHDLKTD